MKKYLFLTGVMAAAVLSGTSAMAQLSYQNGDMLAAFGKSGNSTDVVVDLGSIAQFQVAGASQINFSGVSSALTSVFGGTSGLYWAAFGVNDTSGGTGTYNPAVTQSDPNTVWATFARSNPGIQTAAPFVSGNSGNQNNALGDIQTIAYLAANPSFANNLSPNIASVSSSSQLNGFTPQMLNGDNVGNLSGDWALNMLNNNSGTSDLYQSNPNNVSTAKQQYLGNFVLDGAGNFSFNPAPVPEPSTLALIGGGLMGLLFFRRRK
jgi:hypothetical protein